MKLENSKWEEACFNEEHVAVLTEWATGGQVDLQEAFSYHRSQPSEKSAYHKLKMGQEEGMVYLQPRGGVALLDEHIALLQTLEQEGEADFLPTTIDSYTRQNRYHDADKGIKESKAAGRSMLNGLPAVNYGVKNCRKIVNAVGVPVQVRHGTPDARLLAEITLAAGFTDFEGGGISYNIPYAKSVSLFESQGEQNYFIHKSPRLFLKEQFHLWLHQNLLESSKVWNKESIEKVQVLQKITYKLISLFSPFEEELIRIWNKPKFILKANYVITLDRIAQKDENLIRRLAAHPGIQSQIEEWRKLELVDGDFPITDLGLSAKNCILPIDTKYFKDLEPEILSLFDHLDEQLDGWLIKSENYQALNTILPKFKERVQVIYIDPPFNRQQEPGYSYSVKYKDASWITLLENRLQPARQMLRDTGCIFVRCDYNGNMFVRLLMDQIFGRKNFKNELIIKRSGIQKQAKNRLLVATDSLFFYSKTDKGRPKGIYEPRNAGWLYFVHYPGVRKSTKERHVFGYTLEPPQGRHWGLKQELIDKWVEKRWVRFRCRNCGYEHYSGKWKGCPHCGSQDFIPELKNPPKRIDSNWTNIQSYSQDPAFPTRNAEDILQRVFETASDKGDLVMDFFLGSGTATAVAQKMQRKWIGVEMGEHFYTYVLPRMKRVLAGEQTGISKEVNWQGGGFFKYCELEQYEDTLNKVEYGETAFQKSSAPELLHSYIFLADHEKLDDLERNKDPLHADLSLLYEDVDLSGSLSCLTGQWIRRITPEKVEFEGGSIVKTDNFEWELIKPFIRW